MAQRNWSEFVSALALYARSKLTTVERGTLLIRCTTDGSLIAAVFGNDGYLRDNKSRREADMVRRRVKEMSVAELGFALSPDGHTWALLVAANQQPFHTDAARTFQMEMLRGMLEETVQGAWQAACAKAPETVLPI